MSEERFPEYPSIARLSKDMIITEKIDGTNALIEISDDGLSMRIGSRTRWISPGDDNFGFAKWAKEHEEELLKLGPGRHYGEWWGPGIQRGYGQKEKRFSLFNPSTPHPECVYTVPVLYTGPFSTSAVDEVMAHLEVNGSQASPGFMRPEGVVIFHTASRTLFKKTFEKDGGKWQS